jgi:hypothetical protein
MGAFQQGNRTCVGQSLAFTVTALAIAQVVWCCAIRLAPEACCGGIAAEDLRAQHEHDSFMEPRTKCHLVHVRRR